MRRTLIVLAVILPIVLALLAGSCGRRPRRVVIGIALTKSNHPAVELAAREINEAGGVRGVPVALAGLDWQVDTDFDASEVIAWAKKFSETDDLVAVIGHSDSSSTLSAAAFYNQHAIPQIVTIATNPAITNIGDWTYRLCPSDAVQGDELAKYVVGDWGKRRIAVFAVNDAYGTGLAEVFSEGVRARGAEIVATRLHRNTLQPTDMAMISDTLRGLKHVPEPDLFVLIQRLPAAALTVRAIRENGFRTDILGGDALSAPSFIKSAPAMTEGIRVSEFFYPSGDDARAHHFVDAMRRGGFDGTDYGQAFAYDAVYLVRQAIEANGFGRLAVKRYLDRLIEQQAEVPGAGGAYRIGADHDARRALFVVEARNGVYNAVKTLQPSN